MLAHHLNQLTTEAVCTTPQALRSAQHLPAHHPQIVEDANTQPGHLPTVNSDTAPHQPA